jgi:ATP-dependent Clp protease ATP-binding subunit ClpC
LIGAPPGYVGYEEGGQLTEKIRRRPYAVILLDEIEKAHPEVFNILLQILDDGRLTDGQGRTVDFRNTVIIMTSNIGQEVIQREGSVIGFSRPGLTQDGIPPKAGKPGKEDKKEELKHKLLEEVKKVFRPEFLNRIDDIIVFNPLVREDINKILDIELEPIYARLKQKGINLEISRQAQSFLIDKGFDPDFGARPLKRVIQRYIQDSLALKMLDGSFKSGDKVKADVDAKKQTLELTKQ